MSGDSDPKNCGIGIRGVAMAIDTVVWLVFLFVAVYVVAAVTGDIQSGTDGAQANLEGTPALLSFALWFGLAIGYHTVLEWKYGKTIGKRLVGIRVTNADGSRVSLGSSVVRNVLRLVDWLPMFYVVGIVAIAISKRQARLGDRFGGTTVVRS
ncbi:RDD family protein [Halorussus amylolyticus]|uniref:RDD family protein n=1 Tax=Halorussus amylolyticus TaxID=1126242 RepID=UPI001045B1A6|nr:RDD family protein [Halorussus amylolyticus]